MMRHAAVIVALAAAASAVLHLVPGEGERWAAQLAARPQPAAPSSPDMFFEFIPAYRGSALPGSSVSWSTKCFASVNASLAMASDGRTAELTVAVGPHAKHAPLACSESYLFAWVGAFDIKFYTSAHTTHVIKFDANYSDAQLYDLRTLGARCFQFPHGGISTVTEMLETVKMFVGYLVGHDMPKWSVEANVKFFQDHLNYTMAPRRVNRVDVPVETVHPGDMLVIIRLDGLDPMIAWGMGSRTGHEVMVLEVDGVLSVCESNTKSVYWPIDGIQCSPWADWVDMAEAAQYTVALLPLRPEVRAKFDNAAAVKWVKSLYGLPYGIHTFFSGWIDTDEDNYPGDLSSHLTQILMVVIEFITQDLLKLGGNGNLFAEDMCRRLGKTGLTTAEVYYEAAQQGLSFTDLVKIPSEDGWQFEFEGGRVGPSVVCCVFAANLYKEAGVLGAAADQIRAAEFTNWDVYAMDIFDRNAELPEVCKAADPELPYCQILGDYRMTLEDTYASRTPYAHMMENCPSKAPEYYRPADC